MELSDLANAGEIRDGGRDFYRDKGHTLWGFRLGLKSKIRYAQAAGSLRFV